MGYLRGRDDRSPGGSFKPMEPGDVALLGNSRAFFRQISTGHLSTYSLFGYERRRRGKFYRDLEPGDTRTTTAPNALRLDVIWADGMTFQAVSVSLWLRTRSCTVIYKASYQQGDPIRVHASAVINGYG